MSCRKEYEFNPAEWVQYSPFTNRISDIEKTNLAQILKRQFDPTFLMLRKIVETCPNELWSKESEERPIWIQVYHVAFGIDIWFGETKEIKYPDFAKDVTPIFEDEQHGLLTRQEMLNYLDQISHKVDAFFERHSASDFLGESAMYEKYTHLDSVLEQMRHIMYHVARINGIFKYHGYAQIEYTFYS